MGPELSKSFVKTHGYLIVLREKIPLILCSDAFPVDQELTTFQDRATLQHSAFMLFKQPKSALLIEEKYELKRDRNREFYSWKGVTLS